MDNGWQDQIVGARMSVDQKFADRVQASTLSRPQWGLVMTAVEFDIEHTDDPADATLVADTSKLGHVVPEMQSVDDEMASMGKGDTTGGSSGGVVGGIKNALGLDSDEQDDTAALEETAERLASEYADELQAHLEDENHWETVRRAASDD